MKLLFRNLLYGRVGNSRMQKKELTVCTVFSEIGGPLSICSDFDISRIVKAIHPSGNSIACRRHHFVSSLKVPAIGCYGVQLNVPHYTLNFFLIVVCQSIHIVVLTNDEEMGSLLLK